MYQMLVKNSLCVKVLFRVISQLELFYYRPEENLFRYFEIIVTDHNKVTVMTLQPFTNEQLNYFKFAFVVRLSCSVNLQRYYAKSSKLFHPSTISILFEV